MLRINLSTRPFYNERAVHALIGALALVVLVLTAVNLYEIVQLSRQSTQLSTRVDRDQAEAARLTQEATGIRRGIDQDELQLVVDAAREANSLIDQRTFSWTQFFNLIEANMPPDVMLTTVQPSVSPEATRVSMVVLARRGDDVQEFIEKLEASGAFERLLPSQSERLDNGLTRVLVEGAYVPRGEDPVEAAARAKVANGGAP